MTVDTNDQQDTRDRPFNPFRIAHSETAKTVVADVLNQLQNYEGRFKLRQRARRPTDQKTFERIVETAVCDLVHRELTHPGGWAAIPLSKQVLSSKDRYRSPVLSKALPEVIKRMSSPEMSFVEFEKGHHSRQSNSDKPSRQSVIRAGKRLRARIQDSKLCLSDLGLDKYEETIILRKKDELSKKSLSLRYQDDAHTCMHREQVLRINDWLEQADIGFDHADNTGRPVDVNSRRLVRIFNNGSFQQGGRLYGGFWIPLSQQQRLDGIVINGCSAVSLDFGQMAARTLYGMAGVTPSFDDAYKVPGLEKHRNTVKTVFNSMLHASTRHTRLPIGSRGQLPRGVGADEVINAITAFHSPIKDYFYSGRGMEVMFKESQILVEVLLRLIDEGVVALPIHDAIIVSEEDANIARRTMLDVFYEHTGVAGQVEVEHRD
ncbi:MAG: hypothetical protein A2580_07510 [Hydrogenophilales bacterium RIFOXYD1_FULL_62_11]|nr:MAG: hypothetical protein A2580_07510 [Hydrogenophilales bacterium RIFOXYD1_FULL_62_11]